MKKLCMILSLMLALAMLVGCEATVKSYAATLLATSQRGDEAKMEFATFKGNYDFKLTRDDPAEHTLDLEVSLGEGELRIYIEANGKKELLRTVKGGEVCDEVIALGAEYDNEKTVRIIIETEDKCKKGELEFEYN